MCADRLSMLASRVYRKQTTYVVADLQLSSPKWEKRMVPRPFASSASTSVGLDYTSSDILLPTCWQQRGRIPQDHPELWFLDRKSQAVDPQQQEQVVSTCCIRQNLMLETVMMILLHQPNSVFPGEILGFILPSQPGVDDHQPTLQSMVCMLISTSLAG
jgi:hypothetical protein